MPFSAFFLILLAGVNSTIGNMLLKQSRLAVAADLPWFEKFFSLYFVGAVLFYVANLACFAKALDQVPVSTGYPILAAGSFAMLSISANILFGERFGPWQIGGLILVAMGIFALAQGK
jgi:multidrug transporter EmrE-like cation transporter